MRTETYPTIDQLKAARAWLCWTIDDAATAAGVHRQTVSRVESGVTKAPETIDALISAYEKEGIWFSAGGMVRKPPGT